MDIESIRTFLEVYRTRHFGKAAKNLFVTQSAVSARIRQMEEQLGLALFTRDRNNIQLTAAGQRLLKHAETLLTTWNRARMDVAVAAEARIPLVVGAVPSLWDILVTDWILGVHEREKTISLSGEATSTEALLQRLRDGMVDLAFVYDVPGDANIEVLQTSPVRLVLVSSHKGADAARALSSGYIYVEWGTSFALAHASQFPDAPVPAIRLGMGRVAHQLILKTGGAAYLPRRAVAADVEEGRLFLVEDAPVMERTAHAIAMAENDRIDLIRKITSVKTARRKPRR
jgi:LysR family transcriptional regulator, flagellar master operon regulator